MPDIGSLITCIPFDHKDDFSAENSLVAIIQLADSLFKHFFDTAELYEDDYAYQMNSRYLEYLSENSLELFKMYNQPFVLINDFVNYLNYLAVSLILKNKDS